jgi:hypothetical protein
LRGIAYSTAVSYAERESDPCGSRRPSSRRFALGWILTPQTIGHFPRTLIEQLLAADHLEMWSILAREYDWGVPLLWLAQPVLCLPASETDSDRAMGQLRRALGQLRVAHGG